MVRRGPFDGLFGFSQVVNYFNLGSISFELRWRHQSSYSYHSDELMSTTVIIIFIIQGALLSAALVGLQQQGLALNMVPRVKFVMTISGAKIQSPALAAKAYANKINCTSLHFIGDGDFVKAHGEELADSFVDPLVIRHPAGHTVPRLDEKGLQAMLSFLDKIESGLARD
uniref:Serine hydrolase domain-containing protein n=1 Tax=Triticum aestivum TaxID=4565 RepID=A0A3B6C7X5_WHEAT